MKLLSIFLLFSLVTYSQNKTITKPKQNTVQKPIEIFNGVGIIRLGKSIELIKELENIIGCQSDSVNNYKEYSNAKEREKTITKLIYNEEYYFLKVYNCEKLKTYIINGYTINGMTNKNITLCFYNNVLAYIEFEDILHDLIYALNLKYPKSKTIYDNKKVICPNNTTIICDNCTNYVNNWKYKNSFTKETYYHKYIKELDTSYDGDSSNDITPCKLVKTHILEIESNYFYDATECHKTKKIDLNGL
jgi:hypothetical protein